MEEVSIEEFSTGDFSSSTNASSNDSSNLKEFSADEFLGEKKKNPLMGYDVFIYSLFTFIAPIFFIIAASLFSGLFTFAELHVVLSSYEVVILGIVAILFPIISFYMIRSAYQKYDGSEAHIVKYNKIAKYYLFASITVPLLLSFILPCHVIAALKRNSIPVDFGPIVLTSISETLLPGMLYFILFMEHFERYIYFIPYKKHDTALGFVFRSVLISLVSAIAVVASTIIPFFVDRNSNQSMSTIFWTKAFPIDLISTFLCVFDSWKHNSLTKKRLDDISHFTDSIANRDYTQQEVKVTSRDEFGLLINDINKFHDITKHLLEEFRDTVVISNGTADELAQNMQTTGSVVQEIVKNISSVNDQMTTQTQGVEKATVALNSIMKRIEGLNSNIETQSAAVTQSAAAVNQMVSNIRNVTGILDSNTKSVNSLTEASGIGETKVEEAVRT